MEVGVRLAIVHALLDLKVARNEGLEVEGHQADFNQRSKWNIDDHRISRFQGVFRLPPRVRLKEVRHVTRWVGIICIVSIAGSSTVAVQLAEPDGSDAEGA